VAGPAYTSRAVEAGDSLLKVDGEKATPENFRHLLIGCDVPGSHVTLTISKGQGSWEALSPRANERIEEVTMHRTARSEMNDNVSLLFTF